ncbi:hypothetical protein ABIA35_006298 [Catenulispora sp. MAP12-49]|uniref:galactose-binding domain-containing protein n=1 Tax=Catenulispora sp. MAP12-49 TaxID=3156302 RepID=UPI00351381E2
MRNRLLLAAATAAALLGSLIGSGPAGATTNPPPNPMVTINPSDTQAQILAKAVQVTPTARQLAWQREELTGFVHFGPNTYTGSEVGSGTESPNLIQPTSLDTDQWANDFKNAGFKKVILIAKHHDQLLLDVPPDQSGRFDAADEAALAGFGQKISSTFATDLARGATASNDAGTAGTAGNDPANVVDGDDSTAWQQAATATTIGYQRLVQLPSPVITSKIRLRITGSRSLPPAIATVGLYYDGRVADLAAGTTATQSSNTQPGGDAAHAVDGNTDGDFFDGSVSHTGDDADAWWQTDLGSSQAIGSIALWNRTDCCSNRLSDYWVFVSNNPFTTALTPRQQAAQSGVWSNHQTGQAGTPTALNVGTTGRYVMVQLSGTNYLSLAEVQVFSPADDFSISAGQPMASVPAGTGTTSTITTANTLGTAGNVALSVSGLPAGATASHTPATVTAGGASTLTIHTASTRRHRQRPHRSGPAEHSPGLDLRQGRLTTPWPPIWLSR